MCIQICKCVCAYIYIFVFVHMCVCFKISISSITFSPMMLALLHRSWEWCDLKHSQRVHFLTSAWPSWTSNLGPLDTGTPNPEICIFLVMPKTICISSVTRATLQSHSLRKTESLPRKGLNTGASKQCKGWREGRLGWQPARAGSQQGCRNYRKPRSWLLLPVAWAGEQQNREAPANPHVCHLLMPALVLVWGPFVPMQVKHWRRASHTAASPRLKTPTSLAGTGRV